MNIFVAQCNPTVGDLKGNLAMVKQEIAFAVQQNADVVVFSELVLIGYPPRDLLYKDDIWQSHDRAITQLHQYIKSFTNRKVTVILGGLHQTVLTHGQYARYNAGFVIDNYSPRNRIVHKRLLPCYDVFDETRYFRSAEQDEPYLPIVIETSAGAMVEADLLICEDIWNYKNRCNTVWLPASYQDDPVSHLNGTGPIFVINGSPFWEGKVKTCLNLVESICRDTKRPVVYVNQIGAHDDIVTHGGSMISIPPTAYDRVYTRIGRLFATDQMLVRLSDNKINHHVWLYNREPGQQGPLGLSMPSWHGKKILEEDFNAWCDFEALRLSIIDYCRRTGFKEVVIGLSGGIDSALVAVIACAALGSQNVHGVTMPSKFSSEGSWKDAEELANNLKLGSFQKIPIEDIVEKLRAVLLSGGKQKFSHSVTDENLQPRVRGTILMGLSNDNNWLVLSTGNKSEIAVGYCTLYGDTCGGLALISDIPKTRVFQMSCCINKYAGRELIPFATIKKLPSAELAPGQLDVHSLPSYEDLDPLLDMIYSDVPINEIIKRSSIPNRVHEIVRRVAINEYKRRQIPDGPKVRERSFGSGRRIPVAAKLDLV